MSIKLGLKGRFKIQYDIKYIKLLAIFVLAHESILYATMNRIPSYFNNLVLSYAIIFISIGILFPMFNFKKLIGSFNWVAIICLIGLLYQYVIILAGGSVTPIALPFLPALDETARVYSLLNRPSSFFWEPQSYCSFMFVPLFIALYERKIIWGAVITLSMFLSGSTTGIIVSLLMLGSMMFSSNLSKTYKALFILIGVVMVYLLFNTSYFEAGASKIEETSFEENSRIFNGLMLVFRMPFHYWITGVNYANVADFYFSGEVGSGFLLEKFDTIYVSTIWMILAKFGIVGTYLYIMTLVAPIRSFKPLYIGIVAN